MCRCRPPGLFCCFCLQYQTSSSSSFVVIIIIIICIIVVIIFLSVCFVLQLFLVDRLDIGLLNDTQATGRRRLNQTISQLSDVIQQGLTGTVGDLRFGVTSMRRCASGDEVNNGCSKGNLVATGSPDIANSANFNSKIAAPKCIMYGMLALMALVRFQI